MEEIALFGLLFCKNQIQNSKFGHPGRFFFGLWIKMLRVQPPSATPEKRTPIMEFFLLDQDMAGSITTKCHKPVRIHIRGLATPKRGTFRKESPFLL
jgi:hypothetical protein